MPAQQQLDTIHPAVSEERIVLTLSVRNHPGVMSHICGLFARRAYNLEGILCMPTGDGSQSTVWLLVGHTEILEQMLKQLTKLEDVFEVRQEGVSAQHFLQLQQFFGVS